MKQRSLSSLKKRIKRTARGKYVHRRSGTSHNNSSKSKRRKRVLHTQSALKGTLAGRVATLIPYK
ncbi:50S ribosomal protein L35 [candidate division WOR-3 bacterium]|nr:50S ribosomal protein L35 [candidate division WOR-3 bacterium]